MPWVRKETITPFEAEPPEGLFFLDGDFLARFFFLPHLADHKLPQLIFPSGRSADLHERNTGWWVRLWEGLELPLNSDRDTGWAEALRQGEIRGYIAQPVGHHHLAIRSLDDPNEQALVVYDQRRMIDITPLPEPSPPARMPLLPPHIQAVLPPIGSQEQLGLNATVHVKFFTPDANWRWYASEYDAQDRLFFGLVAGFEVELGYFSLDELESVHGPLGLPIERDVNFTPKTLRDIQQALRQGDIP
jgi:hypothetical protein